MAIGWLVPPGPSLVKVCLLLSGGARGFYHFLHGASLRSFWTWSAVSALLSRSRSVPVLFLDMATRLLYGVWLAFSLCLGFLTGRSCDRLSSGGPVLRCHGVLLRGTRCSHPPRRRHGHSSARCMEAQDVHGHSHFERPKRL